MTDEEPAETIIVEGLSSQEQRHLGVAALLGIDVSVHEVARVAATSPYEVVVALSRAVTLGIMVEQHGDRFTFIHERMREAALATLTVAESLTAHARATQVLTGSAPEQVLRRVHHAFTAARRSTIDAVTAVHIAREAAATFQAAEAFEQAKAVLSRAIELRDAAALPGPFAAVVVEHAEAVLACGHLAAARPLFHRAAQLAEVEADPIILARAALGLGGVWVREHRLSEETERVTALQRRAQESLPQDAHLLRARLAMRIAAENVYHGGPQADVEEGVAAAQRTGDARTLAEALSLYHHTLLAPAHATSRLAVANELIAVASVAHDRMLSLMGLCWRAADLFLLGDAAAGMALTELRLRTEALQCQSVLFIVRAIEVMLAIRSGQFEHAEQAAAECYALGVEVGDADALTYYGAHIAAIRVYQGREAEIAEAAAAIATSPSLTERDRAFASAAALFALRGGQSHQARALLDGLSRGGIDSIMPSSSWLLALHAIIELAAELNDTQNAQAAYEALLPYADLPIMASLAVVCFGSAHRPLAIAALTCGKIDLAIDHFEAAVAANERLGHRPAAIQAQAELALALLQRAKGRDTQRGQDLFEEAKSEASTLGMDGLVQRWQARCTKAQATPVALDSTVVRVSSAPQGGWRIALGKHIATVPDLVGMRYLAQLIAAPNQDVPAVALVVDLGTAPPAAGEQAVMDVSAIAAIRQRIHTLRAQSMLMPDEQDELDALTHELARATGLGGRVRSFADVPERARTAVRKAVKRAIEQVSAANPVVGQHLAACIETGAVCRYRVES
jgi:hypothetical protein